MKISLLSSEMLSKLYKFNATKKSNDKKEILVKDVHMVNGRLLLKKYKRIIRVMELMSILVPRCIFDIIWDIFNGTETKFSLLIRYLYVKKYAKECADNIYIGRGVILKNVSNLSLKSNISIHAYSYIDAAGEIHIGNNVSIANHTSLISFEHTWKDNQLPIKYNKVETGVICIHDDVWIGCGCRILSNVTIGSRTIVAAGAVVNKNVPTNTIVGGVPAKVIKEIISRDELM